MAEQDKNWYFIHAYAGYENYVSDLLTARVRAKKLEDHFGEIIIPVEEVVEMRAGKKYKSKRKFYPGYLLVHMQMNDTTWHLVRSIPRVLGFIGGAISQAEVDKICNQMKEGELKPKPKVLFEPGEVVRVKVEPFLGFTGVVSDVNYEKSRLRVSVLIFGRSVPVELNFGEVEKE